MARSISGPYVEGEQAQKLGALRGNCSNCLKGMELRAAFRSHTVRTVRHSKGGSEVV